MRLFLHRPKSSAALVAAWLLLIVGCGGATPSATPTAQPTETPTATATPTAMPIATPTLAPDALFRQAVANTAAQTGYRFTFRAFGPLGRLLEGSGEWVPPNRYHATQLGAEVITIGDAEYVRALDSQTWREVHREPGGPTPHDGVIIPVVTDVRFDDRTEAGVVRLIGYAQRQAGDGTAYQTPYAIEIDPVSLLITKTINWVERIQPDRSTGTPTPNCLAIGAAFQGCPRAEAMLYDYGAPITIEPPPGFWPNRRRPRRPRPRTSA